ncbi:ATP-binding cassette, subfamily G (WHITE), member 2 [Marchantia polymorpha subsp. ruderalis]|uniref:ABC transporter domain-containing protein n=2 Tax=Marchantia polymorpha TaxID=3197 RepID=A0AAF6BF09_MARPO|nr:hypothetical protein MARPO_0027s0141 [Marchantia polymorpha]PTQ43042.1 hypothetical protein MARPO_0027s0141 [Marchantia polymorpha]BBN10593.1 hypothetical protein Mp_5g04860 [Marchantia polymorpha subsp. ruderalis]BBN10594.1 hypothetical protein Mp_5g04860 [Marchantia polymorpha subsp. ruderalis]|eukprot:PTQ43041.1 hypothetical protein MARPO_0027s0141 [Marchantia polymorpha]
METPTTPVLDPSLERSNSTNYAGSEKSYDKNYTRSARSSFGSRNGDYGDLDLAQLRHSRSQKDSGLVTFKKSFESHRPSLGKFGSQNSVSALDMIANGLDVEDIPYYDLFVRNLSYKVTVKSKGGTSRKTLLNNICAQAFHGQILAVVGPSGSGKTTFLDALAGRISLSSLEGAVYANGEMIDESFKRISGYVMQDDALLPMLTVRETLMYSARLRLPGLMAYDEKKTRVENMINQLGLKQCADTRVGNEKIRGVSGGERRRVSIGADLIHDPPVLFLDEPTSGLDSTSALNVMQNLQNMAKAGRRTVVLTIHQPSYRILETINRVLVLGRGNVIFHGYHAGLKQHFETMGRTMPEYVNVIEYALDTIEEYQSSAEGLEPLINLQLVNKRVEDLEQDMVKSEDQNFPADPHPEYATSAISEVYVLSSRNFKNVMRTPELFYSRCGMMVCVALTMGTLFLQARISEKGARQRVSFISFTLALLIFTSVEAMGIFLEERQIFIRETSRGAYRAATYVISGAIVIIPFLMILAIVFSTISYWLVGLVAEPGPFFFFTLTVFLVLLVANSFVSFVSGLVPNFTVGNSLCSAVIAYFFLFSGFFIERNNIPKYWIWLHYLSLFKYPFESMLENEFGHIQGTWYGDVDSNTILSQYSAGKVHQWINILVMIIFFVGYRVMFWLILKYFTKSIRK